MYGVPHTTFCDGKHNTMKRPPSKMAVKSVTFLLLASFALSQALGPAKTCSTGVAEEDPAAVRPCLAFSFDFSYAFLQTLLAPFCKALSLLLC